MKDENYETLINKLMALRVKISVLKGKKDAIKRNEEQPTLKRMDDISHSINPPHDDPSTHLAKKLKKVASKP